ncbi:PH domain-containing protein [Streptomyces sp. NBC_00069]|uniref:PH domain-containing protein n=1 Tax=Streptomyces sp. NBC_00069 TaxID=2975639 RepID=UPI0032446FE1
MGAQDLPREYRAGGRKAAVALTVLGLMTLGWLVEAWTEELIPYWAKLLSSAVALFVAGIVVTVPRSGTSADRTGLKVKGPLRTRRLAWSEIQDIEARPVGGASLGEGLVPTVITYAYRAGGRRLTLLHLNDMYYDVDREVGVLRAAWTELRDAG